ncbi:(S)-benzoin forming benzil reductase [Cytobacillus sp. FJAT-54145]|uniref:(S)-benzoin forming benzil reductase n=1 Tax=Cytobacillus spartinae TaxID=3299023 RepID=A0ABW6KHE0_9BACI
MKFAIITGASKGLGTSITKRMIEEQIGVITVSRTENEEMKALATSSNLFYQHVPCDLSNIEQIEEAFTKIVELLATENPEEVFVYNNAGMVEPIETVGKLPTERVVTNVQLNLLAPMIISNLFLERASSSKLTIVNITSGAAERPIQGWSTYCSTKAALNMFTKTAALEQQTAGSEHVIIAYSPGIMDTEMQGVIRSSSQESFQDVEKFKDYKEQGLLRDTDTVANALIDLLLANKAESGVVYNVNDLL